MKNKSKDFIKKKSPFRKWKISYLNKLDYKESKKFILHLKTRTFAHPARSIMDFALVRKTMLVNQNVIRLCWY